MVQLEVEELATQAELESLCSAVEHMIQHDNEFFQTHRHADTQTHRHTETQTHRDTDT